jgi:long-chain acyl-CoA synthetase
MGIGHGVMMTTTQMTHISGFGCMVLGTMMGGSTLVLVPKFDPAVALDTVEQYKVEAILVLPAQLQMLVEEQFQRPRVVTSVKMALCGGDSVPEAMQNRFKELFGVSTMEALAMTESCPMLWNTPSDRKLGSVGKIRDGVEVKIATRDGLAADTGELLVRSPANFLGYWNQPEATGAVLVDGWVHTGDLVRLDAENFVWFAGRLKQVIMRESVVISPQEVEDVLYRHPAVLEAGVIGLPDPKFGQKVVAFIALRDGQAATQVELRSMAAKHLADYKVPEAITFLPVLPKGLTGKIDRRALAEGAG